MPKKKFSETRVGKFLKSIAPKILGIIGDVVPTAGILNIQSKTTITKIEIYNQLGQLVVSNSKLFPNLPLSF